ncbi:MAG: hypothetical protein ACO1QB_12525 [Verrucomicrobiales bacterium]
MGVVGSICHAEETGLSFDPDDVSVHELSPDGRPNLFTPIVRKKITIGPEALFALSLRQHHNYSDSADLSAALRSVLADRWIMPLQQTTLSPFSARNHLKAIVLDEGSGTLMVQGTYKELNAIEKILKPSKVYSVEPQRLNYNFQILSIPTEKFLAAARLPLQKSGIKNDEALFISIKSNKFRTLQDDLLAVEGAKSVWRDNYLATVNPSINLVVEPTGNGSEALPATFETYWRTEAELLTRPVAISVLGNIVSTNAIRVVANVQLLHENQFGKAGNIISVVEDGGTLLVLVPDSAGKMSYCIFINISTHIPSMKDLLAKDQ